MLDPMVLLIVMLAGLCPLSFLICGGMAIIIYLQIRPVEYESEMLVGVPPGTASGVGRALKRAGFDVFVINDEKVGVTNIVYSKRRRIL